MDRIEPIPAKVREMHFPSGCYNAPPTRRAVRRWAGNDYQEILMPYYIYTVKAGPTPLIKDLEKLHEFDKFKEAKLKAREIRAAMASEDEFNVKVIFADSVLEAEEKLLEHREAPILREWEK